MTCHLQVTGAIIGKGPARRACQCPSLKWVTVHPWHDCCLLYPACADDLTYLPTFATLPHSHLPLAFLDDMRMPPFPSPPPFFPSPPPPTPLPAMPCCACAPLHPSPPHWPGELFPLLRLRVTRAFCDFGPSWPCLFFVTVCPWAAFALRKVGLA